MFEDEYVREDEYSNRRRRRRRLVCECHEVGGGSDHGCDCGRRGDFDDERDHHHRHHRCDEREHEHCGCGDVGGEHRRNHKCKGCNCEKVRNLDPGDLVLISVVDSLSLLVPLEFVRFNERTCCATFRFPPGGPTIAKITVDCRDIKVLVTL